MAGLRSLLVAAMALAASASLQADEKFGAIASGRDDGSLRLPEQMSARVTHFDNTWKQTCPEKNDEGFQRDATGGWTFKSAMTLISGKASIEERVSCPDANTMLFEASAKFAEATPSNEMSLSISLPLDNFAGQKIEIDGEQIEIPAQAPEKWLCLSKGKFNKIVLLRGPEGKLQIESDGGFLLQDNRKFNYNSFDLRLMATPPRGDLKEASLKVKFSALPYDAKPLDLKSAMNRGFSDAQGGDGKGGWTDQGPENDLNMMKPGMKKLCGAQFDIVDPDKNGGSSCVVVSGDGRGAAPVSAQFDAKGETMKSLCLLHACAWTPASGTKIGTIGVNYQDGAKTEIPVVAGKDVANWWAPSEFLKNAQVAWTGENRSSYVGLYVSEFPVEAKPVASVKFTGEGDSAWMIVAACAANEALPKSKSIPSYVVESKDWKPIEFPIETEPGSALDFSNLADAPAGKYGRTIVKGDKFVFENAQDKELRLYGVNLSFTANYLDKDGCETLAKRLVADGYNSIRIHHFDNQLVKSGASVNSFNPEELDKLDCLFAAMKRHGVYMTTDLFVSRAIKAGEIPELKEVKGINFKSAIPVLDSAMKNWEDFSKSLLTHVNPYTGIAWKDDPALVMISLVNENTYFENWNKTPEIKAIYLSKFEEWLAKRGAQSVSAKDREGLLNAFLAETYTKSFERMRAFLRSLGVRQPLSDQNMCSNPALALQRDSYDYVDNHYYFDHPSFPVTPWRLPTTLSNTSAIEAMAKMPGSYFPTRIFGKPFTITEFNWCPPCGARAEGGLLSGAYASLQGWSGLYRYSYLHYGDKLNIRRSIVNAHFDMKDDPVNTLSDRLGILLFIRGDVQRSKIEIPMAVRANHMEQKNALRGSPALAWKLGLVCQVGTVMDVDGKAKIPSGAKACLTIDPGAAPNGLKTIDLSGKTPESALEAEVESACGGFGKGMLDLERKFARSSTGELELDGMNKTFKTVTPKTEAFALCDKGALSGDKVYVDNKYGFTVVSDSSLDGKAIAESSRMLVLHLTDVLSTKTKFSNAKHTVLESWGEAPTLARRGEASLSIKLDAKGAAPKVYALDLSGKRISEVQSETSASGELTFMADTFGAATPCMAYEIVR